VAGETVLQNEHGGVAVLQDVVALVGFSQRAHRHDDPPCYCDAKGGDHELGPVAKEERHLGSLADSSRKEGASAATRAAKQFRVRQSLVSEDQGFVLPVPSPDVLDEGGQRQVIERDR
jgi:hypothetical protein